jgi:polyisoprenoid-binding protein YceI
VARGSTWVRSAGNARRTSLLGLILLAGAFAAMPAPAPAAELFKLDQRYGSIAFSVSNLGLFRSHGDFARFAGRLTIDPAHPAATRIDVTVASRSVNTPWPQETAMLRSADFFNVARYPDIRFASEQVLTAGPGRYVISGRLTLRGQTRPVTLRAHLVRAARDKATGREIDDFIVTGSLSRKAFGMTADPLFVSDRVMISIHARIILASPHDG